MTKEKPRIVYVSPDSPMGRFIKVKVKFYICLFRAYFEKGASLINYTKYLFLTYGATTQDIYGTIIMAVGFAGVSLVLGMVWLGLIRYRDVVKNEYYSWQEMEHEINNQTNPFMREVRDSIK